MQVIRSADRKVMPWKNGGGTTTEIAIAPDGASLEDFEWRISTANVAADGPFSRFPGIDRTLVLLAGQGIRLAFDDGEIVALGRSSAPYAFAGDRPAMGSLIAGPITDLNVMSRRGQWRHAVSRIDEVGPHRLQPLTGLLILVAHRGGWRVTSRGRSESLGAGDSAILDGAADVEAIQAQPGELYAIRLQPTA